MTDRLYYSDPYRREFDATVASVDRRGGRTIVTLDRTAFYPSSGGQPFDTGSLGGAPVVDVFDDEDGTVCHAVDAEAPPQPGQRVHGVIDWRRRFDHMQQHTGQHVLSAALDRLFGVRTVSFHLGSEVSTIDLAREMTPEEIAAAEDEANRIVWEDRPVTIRDVTAEEAALLPLRKEPARGGTLRVIEVEGFDLSACGGTHVSRSGAIGIIVCAGWERFKGGQRVQFVCGGRALGQFRVLRDANAASVRLLSVLSEEVPSAIGRLQAEVKDQRRGLDALHAELALHRADAMAAAAVPGRQGRVVLAVVNGDASALKALASAVVAHRGLVVVLISAAQPAAVVAARSADVAFSATAFIAALTAQVGGRGGGRDDFAQAGGSSVPSEAVLNAARTLLQL